MMINVRPLEIPDILLITPPIFEDDRGFFFESYTQKKFNELIGQNIIFVQDNHSKSQRGVIRGLHYQLYPHEQDKLVRVIQGEIFDVAVDLRPSSSTFGQWVSALLSAENKHQLWIPKGFAHGYTALSESAEILYKTSNYYAPSYDRSLRWNDPDIGIDWPLDKEMKNSPLLSPKDQQALSLSQAMAELYSNKRNIHD